MFPRMASIKAARQADLYSAQPCDAGPAAIGTLACLSTYRLAACNAQQHIASA